MDLGFAKKTFVVVKCSQIVLLSTLFAVSVYLTTQILHYGILSMPTLTFLIVYVVVFRKNVTDDVVSQERNTLVIFVVLYAVILGALSPALSPVLRGSFTVSQNKSEGNPVSLDIQNSDYETFSHIANKTSNKTAEPSESVRKTKNTINLGYDSYTKTHIEGSDDLNYLYAFAVALIAIISLFQCIVFYLAWQINMQPEDPLDVEAGYENQGTEQTMEPANENLNIEPDSGEGPSSINKVIRRTRRASEGDKDLAMEDLDGVDYDSLVVGVSIELGTQKAKASPISNVSESVVTSLERDSIQPKSGIENLPKVVITETSSQEDLAESSSDK